MLITPAADLGTVAEHDDVEVSATTATTTTVTPLHGQAAWLGESISVHDDAHLLRSPDLAERMVQRLGDGDAVLLRGNGAITVGDTPGAAVTRMWLLSMACDVHLAARATGQVTPLTADEITSWRAVGDELIVRLWQHLRRTGRGMPSGHGYLAGIVATPESDVPG